MLWIMNRDTIDIGKGQVINLTKKRICCLLCCLLLCASMVSASAESGKVVMWTWAIGNFAKINETFFATHDVEWELEEVVVDANDYLTKIQQGYASGGDMPDILLSEIGWRASAFNLGVWENLEQPPYNLDRTLIYDYAIGTTVDKNGHIVGLENGVNPTTISYKRELAKEYLGTDDPRELEAMFPTFESYAEYGKQVYEKSNGTVTLFSGLQDISTMMMSQSRHICNLDENGEILITDKVKPIFSTIEMLREAHACGNITQWSSQWSASFGMSNNIFFPTPPWMIPYQIEGNDPGGEGKWGMFTPAGGSYGWGGTCFGINKESQMKQEAWDFISWWLYTQEGADYFKEFNGLFLPIKSLFEKPEYTRGTHPYYGDQEIYAFMMAELAPTIPAAQLSVYDNLINDSLNMVVQVMTADEEVMADRAYEMFMDDLRAKIPEVTVK